MKINDNNTNRYISYIKSAMGQNTTNWALNGKENYSAAGEMSLTLT